MKKSTFNPDQIALILTEFDNGKSVDEISREYGLRSTSGGNVMVAFMPVSLNGSRSLKKKMPSINVCMPIWPSILKQPGTSSKKSFKALPKEENLERTHPEEVIRQKI